MGNSFSGFHDKDGVLHADAVPLPALAEAHGTPLYVYSASVIRDNIARLRAALGPDVLIAYAAKANTNGAVLAVMAANGLGADVVSGGELQRALRAGIPADKIVFSGMGKTDDELKLAIETGIAQINIESEAELDRLLALDPKTPLRVAFRLNPGVETETTHEKISTGHGRSKFGMPAAEITRLYHSLKNHPSIRPVGFSMHIGSQLTTLDPLAEAFKILAGLAATLPVETLDFGGGLGIVYTDEQPVDLAAYGRLVDTILRPLGTKLITEPGRFLTGNAGLLLSRVLHIKATLHHPIIVLDAGMNDLMRPALYDAVHMVRPVAKAVGNEVVSYDVAGPVCESSDFFMRAAPLPPTHRGDLMALMNAGAYGMSMAGTYNSRPIPAEIMVDGERSAIIRTRQSFDDIIRGETIPDWVKT